MLVSEKCPLLHSTCDDVPAQEMVVAASSSLKNYNKLYVVQTKIKLNVYTYYARCAKKIRK
jgi:hypothetical protein